MALCVLNVRPASSRQIAVARCYVSFAQRIPSQPTQAPQRARRVGLEVSRQQTRDLAVVMQVTVEAPPLPVHSALRENSRWKLVITIALLASRVHFCQAQELLQTIVPCAKVDSTRRLRFRPPGALPAQRVRPQKQT